MKLKVCGLKQAENIKEIADLDLDYIGFIFFEASKRNFTGQIPTIAKGIKKTGVFVNASITEIIEKITSFDLQAVQLHGDESTSFIKKLKFELAQQASEIEIFKVFSIANDFDFNRLDAYEAHVDYFLFDTKGKERGGNGVCFDWSVLNDYPLTKPFILSGGIGLEQVEDIRLFLKNEVAKYCYALDVNSKFEIEAGLKDSQKVNLFKQKINALMVDKY